MKLSDYSFRDLYKQCLILKSEWVYDGAIKMLSEYAYTAPPGMDAALCFCYLDTDAGMSFYFLSLAGFESGEIDIASYELQTAEKLSLRFRYGTDIEVKVYTKDITCYANRIEMVDTHYHRDESVLPTRNITAIDHLRNDAYPDDIKVLLRKDELQIEQVWVKLTGIEDGNLAGVLLNEPHSDFGVNMSDIVHVQVIQRGSDVYAVCLFPK